MNRLTERDWKNKCEGYPWNVHPVKDIDDLQYYKKLALYEDAEEHGLLLRLPCKVGDTIYEVSYENRKYVICEHIVNQFVYTTYRKPRIEIYCEGENGFLSSSITGQLDDGLFLNREEAESKLKELEGRKDE